VPGEPTAPQLRAAFGAFPTGVVAVAAEVDGQVTGLAASSFTSVSLDPPLVSFAIAGTSRTWPALARAPRLGVTVLAEHHHAVARQLAGPSATRFTGLDLVRTEHGAVTLADGVAWFDTSIQDTVTAGDHTIVLLRPHTAAHADDPLPLVFHRSRFARTRPLPGAVGPDPAHPNRPGSVCRVSGVSGGGPPGGRCGGPCGGRCDGRSCGFGT
jgi:flavin reductase (DIM6/NTAB) family NADH-FMN oxidoreductase RutF